MSRWISWLYATPRRSGAPVAPSKAIRANRTAVLVGCILLSVGVAVFAFPDTSGDIWWGVLLLVGAPVSVVSIRRYRLEFAEDTITLQWLLHHRVVNRSEIAGVTAARNPVRPWALGDLMILLRDDDVVSVPQALLFWKGDYRKIASQLRAWAETEQSTLKGGDHEPVA